jgi:hypothetical protein
MAADPCFAEEIHMVHESVQPYTGPLGADLQPIANVLVVLTTAQRRSMRWEQEGVDQVVEEVKQNMASAIAKAIIPADVYAHFNVCNDNIAKIRAVRAIFDKLADVLEQSEAYYEHEREANISMMAAAVRSAARLKDDSIRALFEKTLKYNAQIASKALKTRRKNAKVDAGDTEEQHAAPVQSHP